MFYPWLQSKKGMFHPGLQSIKGNVLPVEKECFTRGCIQKNGKFYPGLQSIKGNVLPNFVKSPRADQENNVNIFPR